MPVVALARTMTDYVHAICLTTRTYHIIASVGLRSRKVSV